ncbi:MAG: S-layer homology domain-containing protein, partial [Clostridia bacterium]|nr:S-layer homology domain-containing protein [Clostridia bacterium]
METILRESGKADIYANFTDTDSRDVLFLYKLGIIKGKSDTVFAPNDTITRQEASVIMFNLSKFLGICPFLGVSKKL